MSQAPREDTPTSIVIRTRGHCAVRPLHIHSRSLRHDLISGRFYLRHRQGRGGRGGLERRVMGRWGGEGERERSGRLVLAAWLPKILQSGISCPSHQISRQEIFTSVFICFRKPSLLFPSIVPRIRSRCSHSLHAILLVRRRKTIASLPITAILGIVLQCSDGRGAYLLQRGSCGFQHWPIST